MFAGDAIECGFSCAEVVTLVRGYALVIFCGHSAVIRSVGGGRLRLWDLGADGIQRLSHVRAALDVVEFLDGSLVIPRVECFYASIVAIVFAAVLSERSLRHFFVV